MSHNKLRTEKNCLNCGSHVDERYCGHCGQENLEIQDSAFHLIIHYIQDLFHYDGKLWHTLKNLLVKPGSVAAEYMEGRRMQNLEPIRFYVFSSTIFFLLLFAFVGSSDGGNPDPAENYPRRLQNLKQERKFIGQHPDTAHIDSLITPLRFKIDSLGGDSIEGDLVLDFDSPIQVDSAQGWFERLLYQRAEARRVELDKKYGGDISTATSDFLDELFHKFPVLLFLSMPFFALILKLLYFRSTRKHYVQHFIFSVYHYAYLFVMASFLMLSQYVINKIFKESGEAINGTILAVFIVYFMIYLWLSMKRFFGDRWFLRLPRYLVLIFSILTIMLVLFLFFFFFTLLG